MNKVCGAEEAVAIVNAGDTVGVVGVIGWLTPDALLGALAQRFRDTGSPSDLTFYFPCGTGDALEIAGMDHVALPRLMKRIVSGSYINPRNPRTGARPKLMDLIHSDSIEAYSWPIGASMHWLREVARRSPGYLTRVGIGTYVDPRESGGRLTARAKEDLIEVVNFKGQEYLFYPAWPLNVGILRASSSDDLGNLSFEREPLISSSIALAMAVKASGGTVIAQVGGVVPRGSRPAQSVRVPADLVDYVVVDEAQVMGTETAFDPRYLGEADRWTPSDLPRVPLGADRVIARRAATEVVPGITTIFGFGASSDVPLIMAEQGSFDDGGVFDYRFTTEHGPFGGVVMSGWQFSANIAPEALVDGVSQFDYIDGGNCKCAVLSFAEFDSEGTVNVSRFGNVNPGAGGFIDIAQNAGSLIFTGSFCTGGLQVEYHDGKLEIVREGQVKKLVRNAQDTTYRVGEGVNRGQIAMLITERAVFDIQGDGLVLKEIAPGIDLQRDVLDQMEFPPLRIDSELRTRQRVALCSFVVRLREGLVR